MHKLLFNLLILSMTLSTFGAVYKDNEFNLYLFDIAVCIFVLYTSSFTFSKTRDFGMSSSLFFKFVPFCLVAFLSLIINSYTLSSSAFLVSLSYIVRFVGYLVCGYFIGYIVNSDILSRQYIIKTVLFYGVLFIFAGFVQLVVLPDFAILDSSLGWDPHKNRLASTFFDPNFAGGFIVILMLLTLSTNLEFLKGSMLTLSRTKNSRAFDSGALLSVGVIGLLFLIGIFLTFSRSAWLMLAVVVFIYGIFKYRWLLLVAITLAFLAYFAVPRVQTRLSGTTDPADSAAFRLISWKNSVEIFLDNPLIGIGFNSYRYAQKDYGFIGAGELGGNSGAGADSSLLLVMATTGALGLICFIYPFFSLLRSLYLDSLCYEEFIFYLSLFAGLLLESQFVNSIFYPQIMFMWILLLSLSSKNSFSRI